jgi:hypothetical protein
MEEGVTEEQRVNGNRKKLGKERRWEKGMGKEGNRNGTGRKV